MADLSIGTGIAIAGIWGAVAVIGMKHPVWLGSLCLFAALTSCAITHS